jgi:hypothetical protein
MQTYDKSIKVGDTVKPKKNVFVDFTKEKVKSIIQAAGGDTFFELGKGLIVDAWKVKKCNKK